MELWQKYPFSEEARRRARQAGMESASVAELEDAAGKVLDVLRGGKPGRFTAKEYALARLLLAAGGGGYALAEFSKRMAQAYAAEIESADEAEFNWIAKQAFPSFEASAPGGYSIAVLDYVVAGKNLAGEQVGGGRVEFSRRGFLKLLAQAVEEKIKDVKVDAKAVPAEVRDAAKKLSADAPKPKFAAGDYKGRYLTLPAVQAILAGVGEGKRYYASVALAIACLKDKMPRAEAEAVMRTYAKNCPHSTHPFTEREALASMDWVYKHPTINFSLKTLREQQIVDEDSLRKTSELLRQRRTGAGIRGRR